MATASPKFPRFVSSIIAVVITLVLYCTLPPTMETAPTSAMERPNPVKTTDKSCPLFSCSRYNNYLLLLMPIPMAVSLIWAAFICTALAVSPVMIGVISNTWAITIAGTV